MVEAIAQLYVTFIVVCLVIGWLGIGAALSGLAILIYRLIRL